MISMVLYGSGQQFVDIKRPCPAFTETIEDPETSEHVQIKGDGNIDYSGDISLETVRVCGMHRARDT